MPHVATVLPIPRRYAAKGIRRYGFHGLSYEFLMQELARLWGSEKAMGRIILAHLGSGASITAVHHGKSMDTSMGFTPAGGLPMSTRAGNLDPGVAWCIIDRDKLTPPQFNHLINHECGLIGVSALSGDMNVLLQKRSHNIAAAEAVELFCYEVKKYIGAYAAVLGGLDMLVFSGGIGENSPVVRAEICSGLGFLGIAIDEKKNNENSTLISGGQLPVYMIHTDEELMIAQTVKKLHDQILPTP